MANPHIDMEEAEALEEDSRYHETKKAEVVNELVDWLLETTRLSAADIETYLHHNHEAYASIELDHEMADRDYSRFTGWNTEQVRNVTSQRIDFLDVQGHTLSVAPEDVRKQD